MIPAHLHGLESDSFQVERTCFGSVVMAALRAKSEIPSELSEEVKEMENVKK